MRVKHIITFPEPASRRAKLLGFQSEPVEVYEDDERWAQVQALVRRYDEDTADIVDTTFSEDEILSARWLQWEARWWNDYPFPDNNFGYRARVNDTSNYCATCGIGAVQRQPFQIKKVPRWGRRWAFHLHWEHEKWFIRRDVFEKLFAPAGMSSWPVWDRRGRVIESVLQLNVDKLPRVSLAPQGWPTEQCPDCGRVKYNWVGAGLFAPLAECPSVEQPCVVSQEWFGSEGEADRATFISHEFFQAIRKAKLDSKTMRYRPVECSYPP